MASLAGYSIGQTLEAPEPQDERKLIEAAQADRARFLELYDRCFHRSWAYVIRRTADRAEAEDVTSEVFRRAIENIRAYEWRGSPFIAWLLRIAANTSPIDGREPGGNLAILLRIWLGRAMPGAFYLYVPDADALYQQAVDSGAKPLTPPSDQSYGDRMGGVEDAWGNTWYIASARQEP